MERLANIDKFLSKFIIGFHAVPSIYFYGSREVLLATKCNPYALRIRKKKQKGRRERKGEKAEEPMWHLFGKDRWKPVVRLSAWR